MCQKNIRTIISILTKTKTLFAKFFRNLWIFKNVILTWIVLVVLLLIGIHLNLDAKILSAILIVLAFITKAFSGLFLLIGLVPVIGPFLVQILTLPLFWILNGIGYLASIVAIKKGHGKEVITHRILTIIFLIGVACGFIISRLIR